MTGERFMFRSMFARLFAMFLGMMLVLITILAMLSYVAIRDDRINARMEELKSQAREIAYLAGQVESSSLNRYLGLETTVELYMQWKAQNVYEEFGAYILVVDRQRNIMDNLNTTLKDNVDIAQTLNVTEIVEAVYRVLSGEEIQVRTNVPGLGGPVFTVAVPWVQRGMVLGAVLIHTSAQVVEAEYKNLIWQVLAGAGVAVLLAAVSVYFFTRQVTKPLAAMAQSARDMAKGRFETQAQATGVSEIQELAAAFNSMAGQLQATENSRREFVANVSHELRSPMTSIQGFVEGMQDGTIPLEEHPKYLKIVGDEAKRLTKLIADLLNLSRLEQSSQKPVMQPFDINELIRRVAVRRANDIDQKNLEMEIDFHKEQCYCLGDSDRIEQVVINLLDNAIKFTPEGGQVRIETTQEDKKVLVTVSDNGEGILPQDQPHIFERFYKADKAHTVGKGTGLGLSICRRILEAHGETIRLLPTRQGAAFQFTLSQASAKGGREKGEQGEEDAV